MVGHYKRAPLLGMIMLLWMGIILANGPDTLWTRTYGGDSAEVGYSVQQTYDEGYIITGYTKSFGAGLSDVYLIKTDEYGDTTWTKTYGGSNADVGYSVQQTSDSGYIIAGYTKSFGEGREDVYLIKTDENGDVIWSKTYGGPYIDVGRSVQQTSDSGYIVAGWTKLGNSGDYDVYLIQTDARGDTLWTRKYGTSICGWRSDDRGYSVQQTSDSGYIITGYTDFPTVDGPCVYLIKTEAGGDTIWTKVYGSGASMFIGYSLQQTIDGGYIIAGLYDDYYKGSHIYLIKTDSIGNTIWTGIYGGCAGYSVQQTPDGGYIVAGVTAFSGWADINLVKIDSIGDTIWTKIYGGTEADEGWSVRKTFDGEYIVAGGTQSFGAGDWDVYLIKTEVDPVSIEEEEYHQKEFFISQCVPNPFKNRTLIQYGLPKSSNVRIVISNLIGQEVRTLINKKENAGQHMVMWDGRDNSGKKVSSGVYFLKFQTGEYDVARKLFLIK
ncbi:hypothetical protein CH333_01950 [candidate division WOR-3 bacterium JGI_Cruoil_03_44_89]|uniref:FlgD/Vpr Ig-like domain-containing protein n=1 Tax=candidate division WOR-3 bacterium JGI_Cruoil_03_44_89 TaxID=1973748 RepID=A0A235BZX6_UNCW3|nr:MAG: hypothetical protein CH333_01950 [candidate division WOR-3 bacterium JGI_Cruoil_03_44_89]